MTLASTISLRKKTLIESSSIYVREPSLKLIYYPMKITRCFKISQLYMIAFYVLKRKYKKAGMISFPPKYQNDYLLPVQFTGKFVWSLILLKLGKTLHRFYRFAGFLWVFTCTLGFIFNLSAQYPMLSITNISMVNIDEIL